MTSKSTRKLNPDAMMGGFARLTQLAAEPAPAPAPSSSPAGATTGVVLSLHPEQAERPEATTQSQTPVPAAAGQEGYVAYDPSAEYPVGARIVLPLDLVEENPLNPRVFFSETEIQTLIKSLGQNGQLTAVQVYPRANGKFMLKSGHRRCRSLRVLGRPTVKVEVVKPGEGLLKDYKEAREINLEHKSQTHFDDAVRFSEILEKEGIEQKALAEALSIPDSDISKILSIGSIPRSLIEKMAAASDLFGLTSSYLVYRFWVKTNKDETRTEKLIQKVIEGRLSSRALENMVKESGSTAPEKKRERALSRAEVKGAAQGEVKAFDGRLTVQLEGLSDELRDLAYVRIVGMLEELSGVTVDKAATNAGAPPLS